MSPYVQRQDPIPITITISGSGGCGKSSITLRLVRSQWISSYDPTIEDSYSVTRVVDGQPYILSITDTAGQEEYRNMWAATNLQSDAFLLVYDITSYASLEELEFYNGLVDMETEQRDEKNAAFDEIRRRAEKRAKKRGNDKSLPSEPSDKQTPKMLAKPVKILAGNKCDLSANRQVSASVGLDWARKRGCGFMETSARNEVNIEETFALIVRRVMEARRIAEMASEQGLEAMETEEAMASGYDRSAYDKLGRRISASGGRPQPMNINTTQPLSPLPTNEKSFMDDADGGTKWWDIRRFRCW